MNAVNPSERKCLELVRNFAAIPNEHRREAVRELARVLVSGRIELTDCTSVMRFFVISAFLISLAVGSAWAQQARTGTGGTCSGHRASCDSSCTPKAIRCPTNCEAAFNSCMQTGEWRGGHNTFIGVERK